MHSWLISIPVWGERYLKIFEQMTVPAIRAMIKAAESLCDVTLVIFTNDETRVTRVTDGLKVIILPMPGDPMDLLAPPLVGTTPSWNHMRDAYLQVLNSMASVGTRVCLLTSDMVPSSGAIIACEKHFAQNKQIICIHGMRVCDDDTITFPIDGESLAAWGWARRHPETEAALWPNGNAHTVWRIYFASQDFKHAVCRVLLPHPFALVKPDRELTFYPTIDVTLFMSFSIDTIYLVTDPTEFAVLKLSPRSKPFITAEPLWHRFQYGGPSMPSLIYQPDHRQRSMFVSPIRIVGDPSKVEGAELVQVMVGDQVPGWGVPNAF